MISKELKLLWYKVKIIWEIATQVYDEWLHHTFGNISKYEFQKLIMHRYRVTENKLINDVDDDNSIVIFDRWAIDWVAFLSNKDFIALMSNFWFNNVNQNKALVFNLESLANVWKLYYKQYENWARSHIDHRKALIIENKIKNEYIKRNYRVFEIENRIDNDDLRSIDEKTNYILNLIYKFI